MFGELDEQACLAVNPFEGDFGGTDDRTLRDKIGLARKENPCFLCGQTIRPGELVRMMAAVFDGELCSYRWCSLCCYAMAASWHDGGEAMDARYWLRIGAPTTAAPAASN